MWRRALRAFACLLAPDSTAGATAGAAARSSSVCSIVAGGVEAAVPLRLAPAWATMSSGSATRLWRAPSALQGAAGPAPWGPHHAAASAAAAGAPWAALALALRDSGCSAGPTATAWLGCCLAASRGLATITSRKAAANPGLKYWKPTSPGQRGRVTIRRASIWRGGPVRCLARGEARSGGRNHSGRITVWHRGGGARKVVRLVDFRRRPDAPPGVVERLEYDPGRTAYVALVRHNWPGAAEERELEARAAALRPVAAAAVAEGRAGGGGGGEEEEYLRAVAELLARLKAGQRASRLAAAGAAASTASAAAVAAARPFSYIVAPQGLRAGDAVSCGEGAPVALGNTLRLRDIPVGMPLHNLEMRPGQGAVLCRAAGCVASIVNKQETHAIVRLPSGEQRLFPMGCRATVGAVSNPQHQNRVIGKAGYARHMGRRPIVRGVAMNPVDHPHGGGTAGGRPSVTPWGIPCKGYRTRRHSPVAKWILVPRRRGKGAQRGAAGAGGEA